MGKSNYALSAPFRRDGGCALALNVNIHVHMPVADETPVELHL